MGTVNTYTHEAKALIKQANQYDAMIEIYSILDQMKTYIFNQDNKYSLINQAKIGEINALQAMLVPTAIPTTPRERLLKVKAHGVSEDCVKTLTSAANDPWWIFLKRFFSALTGWQSKEEKIPVYLFNPIFPNFFPD